MNLDLLVAEHPGDQVVGNVQSGYLHQAATDSTVIDHQLHLAVRAAEQGGNRVAGAGQVGIAIEFPQTGLHGLEVRYQILESETADRKSTRLNSSHVRISYAVFCLK